MYRGWFLDLGEGLKGINTKTQTVVAAGHTHGADAEVGLTSVNGKTRHTSIANVFSPNDIDIYNNAIQTGDGNTTPNVFGKKTEGMVITSSGGMLHYDPNKDYEDKVIKDSNGEERI